jgi:hypothetical protein
MRFDIFIEAFDFVVEKAVAKNITLHNEVSPQLVKTAGKRISVQSLTDPLSNTTDNQHQALNKSRH